MGKVRNNLHNSLDIHRNLNKFSLEFVVFDNTSCEYFINSTTISIVKLNISFQNIYLLIVFFDVIFTLIHFNSIQKFQSFRFELIY
jgi:hypothetical protein